MGDDDNWWWLTDDEMRQRHPINKFVRKHQLHFARYFLPKHVYSVHVVYLNHLDDEILQVVGRVKPMYYSTKGKTQEFEIEMSKYNVWKNNIGLYTFISSK